MKPFIYTATLTSALIFSIGNAQATNLPQKADRSSSFLTSSSAFPRNARAPFARYHIGLQVSNDPLSRLAIGIPPNLHFSGITVTDAAGQEIQAITISEQQTLLIHLMQPVAPNRTLRINLNSVQTGTRTGRIWLFPISETKADGNITIPIGIARIHTYS